MKILITGATGFVGRNVLMRALAEPAYDEILLPVRSIEKLKKQFEMDGFRSVPSKIRPLLAEAPDWKLEALGNIEHVVHSAGVLFGRNEADYFKTNVEGTLNLLSSIGRPSRILILSSQAASGPCSDKEHTRTELDPESPLTLYGKSKLTMERLVQERYPELNYIFLRPPMILGARDQATLPLFKMAKKKIHFKPGFQPKAYSFISVLDLVSAIFTVLNSNIDLATLKNRTFFISSNEPITDLDLISGAAFAAKNKGFLLKVPQAVVKGISRLVDSVPAWREAVPSLSGDRAKEIWPDRWVVSSDAFQEAFRWKPTVDLKSSLQSTHDWYLKTGQLR